MKGIKKISSPSALMIYSMSRLNLGNLVAPLKLNSFLLYPFQFTLLLSVLMCLFSNSALEYLSDPLLYNPLPFRNSHKQNYRKFEDLLSDLLKYSQNAYRGSFDSQSKLNHSLFQRDTLLRTPTSLNYSMTIVTTQQTGIS